MVPSFRKYPLGTPPDAIIISAAQSHHFPGFHRQRVIVEAGETQRRLDHCNVAAEQGRELFAVPGKHPGNPKAKVCNRLIPEGAHPYLKPQDVRSC